MDLVVCFCSVPAPVFLPSDTCAALWIYLGFRSLDPWLPWLVRVVEQYVVGDKLGLLLGDEEKGGITVLYIVASAAVPKYNLFLIIKLMAWMSLKQVQHTNYIISIYIGIYDTGDINPYL